MDKILWQSFGIRLETWDMTDKNRKQNFQMLISTLTLTRGDAIWLAKLLFLKMNRAWKLVTQTGKVTMTIGVTLHFI